MTNRSLMVVYDRALRLVSNYEQVEIFKKFVDNFHFQDFLLTALSKFFWPFRKLEMTAFFQKKNQIRVLPWSGLCVA